MSKKNRKGVKVWALAVLMGLSVILSACDNPIRDVVLVPENGYTCAGGSWGMPCDNK